MCVVQGHYICGHYFLYNNRKLIQILTLEVECCFHKYLKHGSSFKIEKRVGGGWKHFGGVL